MNDELGQEFEAIRAMMKITSELDTDAAKRATQYVTQMLWEREGKDRLKDLNGMNGYVGNPVLDTGKYGELSGLDY